MTRTRRMLTLGTAMALCGWAAVGAAGAEEVTIGLATGQTGGLAPFDQPSLAGFRMAMDEINAKGGLGGKYIVTLDIKDTRSDTGATVQAAQELVAEGVKFLITPCDADPSIAAGQISQAAQIPTMTFCGTTPTITDAVGDYMFGSYPADNGQATLLAQHAIAKGYKSAYVLKSPDSAYTLRLPEYFAEVFQKLGGTVAGEGTYSLGQQDFAAEVTKIAALDPQPDVIMTAAYEPDFPAFLKALRGAGVTAPILGSDGIDSPTTTGLGDIANGIVHTTAGFPTDGSPLGEFYAKYEAVTGAAPETVYVATGYEIPYILDAAVTAAGTMDGPALRDALANLENVPVLTGSVTYKGTNRMPLRAITLVEIQGGARAPIETATPDPALVPAP
ncbi:ABC transporter substrate-binding protein [Frigidibacter sp. RF13]|uniref:ABC transporter substrate-binding protein n=1 Tax=Frigidibacter sp. RF13 TaxID=2997340 RepID=UPI002270A271|nr:ABC transporter substrate-binding protein [Frigidibacter sp. RF13]MCY1127481.1 ABC transporter substrate-binding protein [Frigidibacter sp. RF13]